MNFASCWKCFTTDITNGRFLHSVNFEVLFITPPFQKYFNTILATKSLHFKEIFLMCIYSMCIQRQFFLKLFPTFKTIIRLTKFLASMSSFSMFIQWRSVCKFFLTLTTLIIFLAVASEYVPFQGISLTKFLNTNIALFLVFFIEVSRFGIASWTAFLAATSLALSGSFKVSTIYFKSLKISSIKFLNFFLTLGSILLSFWELNHFLAWKLMPDHFVLQ